MTIKIRLWFCLWISGFGLIGAAAGESVEKPPVYLSLGEQRLLKIPGLLRYSLGGETVRAQNLPSQATSSDLLLLKGVQTGPSDLWVWLTDGTAEHRTIRVEKTAASDLKPALAQALEKLTEVEILYSGSGVILRGEIQSLSEASRVRALSGGAEKSVHDETEPSESLIQQASEQLSRWLKASPYASRLRLIRQDKTLRITLKEGSLDGPQEKAAIEKRVLALYPLAQLELETLPDSAPTVHFKVFLLELKKTKFRSLGLGWPGFQEGAFRVTSSSIQDLLQLDLTLQALEGDGSVKILSNPEIAVRAPGEAELFSGGEIPIQTQSQYFSAVTWKNFGLTLKLKVTHSAGDRVRLDIMTEVSHLDPTLTTEKVPGIQANRMKTQVDARYGRPLLLSGLLQQNVRKQARGLPLLRQIPILGSLFGSEDYLNEKSELVAILVPSSELPSNPMERITRILPKGPLPLPRSPSSPEDERRLRQSADFPWNVLR